MLLRMNDIQQKTPNGVFYYRRKLPSDLIELLGKREIKLSLKTKDPIVAQTQELANALDTIQTYAGVIYRYDEITHNDEESLRNKIRL